MLKWLSRVTIPLLTLVVLVVACAGPAQVTTAPAVEATEEPVEATAAEVEAATSEPEAEAEVVTLKFWNGFNAAEVDSLGQMVDKYWTPMHPNIQIDMLGEQSPESILTAISGGEPPDVAILWDAAPVTLWARQGAIMDLTPQVEAAGLDMESIFVPAGLDWVTYDGKYYGLPFVNFNYGFYWNKALFREAGLDPDTPPETIAELEEYARKLTVVDDSGNITQLGWMPVNGSFWIDLAMAFGGNWYDPETGTVTGNDPKNVEAFEWDLALADEFGLEKVTNFTSGFMAEGNNPFFLGKVAMSIEGCWNVAFIKEYAPDLEYGVAAVPAADPAYAESNGVGTNPIIIPNGVAHPEEAWEFALFLATNVDVSQGFADLVSNIPQVSAAVEGFSTDPNTQFFAELSNSPNARAWYPLPVAAQCDDELGAAVEKMYTGQATPQDALDTAQKNLEAALEGLQ
jgi:multiple sugar transport system substrate-binding protein